jgi:uncharacterized protein
VILVWRGLDDFRAEYADARVEDRRLFSDGIQIGVSPEPYVLRYRLEPGLLEVAVDGGRSLRLELGDHDAFDLGFSPLFNSIPVLRDDLHRGGEARDYVMAWVSVPALAVERSEQRYEPVSPGRVRFRAGSFAAELELDEAGFVRRYEGLAERMA